MKGSDPQCFFFVSLSHVERGRAIPSGILWFSVKEAWLHCQGINIEFVLEKGCASASYFSRQFSFPVVRHHSLDISVLFLSNKHLITGPCSYRTSSVCMTAGYHRQQCSIQWLYPGVQQPDGVAEHIHPSSTAEVKCTGTQTLVVYQSFITN